MCTWTGSPLSDNRSRANNGANLGKRSRPPHAVGLRLRLDAYVLHVLVLVPPHRPANALVEGDRRGVSQEVVRLAHVRARVGDVPRLIGQHLHFCVPPYVLLDDRYEFFQARAAPLPEVENLVGVGPVDGAHDAVHDVVDVGVVPARAPVTELLELEAAGHAIDELEGGHVRPAAWSVDREETQSGDVEPVEVVVGVRQELACLLGRGVRAHGVVDALVLAEEGRLRPAVHARRAGEDEVLDAELVAELHEVGGPAYVRMDVDVGILDGGTDAGAGGHVAHPARTLVLEQREHELLVTDVAAVHGQASRVVRGAHLAETAEVVLLDADVVIVVHLVDDHDGITPGEQVHRHRRADEARAAGDEDLLAAEVGLQGRGPAFGAGNDHGGGGRGFVVGRRAQVAEVRARRAMSVANIRGGGGLRDCVVRHHLVAGRIVLEVRERGHTLGVMKPHDIVC